MSEPDDTGGRDPRWAASDARLVELLRDEILSQPATRITFARFMQRALTEPELGYYASSERRPTRAGDFLTAPELHPFFGRCIGRFAAAARATRAARGGRSFRVLEYGAGRGTLRDGARPELGTDVAWARVDLPHRSDTALGPADLVLANEFVDALPVHRLVYHGELLEAFVTWVDGWFGETLDVPSTPALAAHLAANEVELREGQRAEVCLAACDWMRHAASQLAEGGVVLVIDYGHEAAELYGPRRMAGSLLTYRQHEVADDPYAAVGNSDITSHVDVTALDRAARAAGLVLVGATTQGPFLARLGLGGLLSELGRQPDIDPMVYLEARSAVVRMLDPRHLGGFRVLAWARRDRDGTTPTLPGFGAGP